MSAPSTRPGPPPRILVVEDDADLLNMLGRMLGAIGEVSLASDGIAALELLERGPPPDLVITDLMMPRLDGLSLARLMKDNTRLSRIPVIMLTARGGPRDVIAGINAGARHYVSKPFKSDELLGKVKKLLGR